MTPGPSTHVDFERMRQTMVRVTAWLLAAGKPLPCLGYQNQSTSDVLRLATFYVETNPIFFLKWLTTLNMNTFVQYCAEFKSTVAENYGLLSTMGQMNHFGVSLVSKHLTACLIISNYFHYSMGYTT